MRRLARVVVACVAGAAAAAQQTRPQGTERAGARSADRFSVDHDKLEEVSGLVVSAINPGWSWAHNDSGAGSWLYAIDGEHRVRFRLKITGARSMDWEDMAQGPGLDGASWLFVADVGRNLAGKKADPARIWAIPEPVIGTDLDLAAEEEKRNKAKKKKLPSFRSPRARCFELAYPTRDPPDAEAMFVYPGGKALAVIAKRANGRPAIYGAALPEKPAGENVLELREVAALDLRHGRKGPARKVTGATVTRDGRHLVIVTYTHLVVLPMPPQPGEVPIWLRPIHTQRLPPMPQVEACAVSADGKHVVVASEGRPARFAVVTLPDLQKSRPPK